MDAVTTCRTQGHHWKWTGDALIESTPRRTLVMEHFVCQRCDSRKNQSIDGLTRRRVGKAYYAYSSEFEAHAQAAAR